MRTSDWNSDVCSSDLVVDGSYRKQFTDVPDVQMGHLPQVMVLGYDAVMKVLTQPDIFRNKEAFENNLGRSFGNTITVMDAPIHTRFRKMFQKASMPQAIAQRSDARREGKECVRTCGVRWSQYQ